MTRTLQPSPLATTTAPSPPAEVRPIVGIVFIVSAMLLVPVMDAIAKHLSADYSVLQVVWGRFFFHFLFLLPLVLSIYGRRALLKPRQPGLQLLRGGFLLVATMFFFGAISAMPLVDALALLFISPMVVTALSALILKEPVGPRRWAAVGVGFLGALIILRPGLGVFQGAALLAAAAGLCHALYLLTTRRLSGSAPPLVTLTYTAIIGAFAMTAIMPFFWIRPALEDLLLMAVTGLIAAVGHFLLIRAFDYGEAALLAPFTYTEIVMATLLGYFWFGDFPDLWSWLGIAVLIASGIYISLRERRRQAPQELGPRPAFQNEP